MPEYYVEDDYSQQVPDVELADRVNEEQFQDLQVLRNHEHLKGRRKEEDDAHGLTCRGGEWVADHDYRKGTKDDVPSLELLDGYVRDIYIKVIIVIVNSHHPHHNPDSENYQSNRFECDYGWRRAVSVSEVNEEALIGADNETYDAHDDIQEDDESLKMVLNVPSLPLKPSTIILLDRVF